MKKTTLADAALLDVVLDRQADLPLFEQLVKVLRQIILGGRLGPGAKLPSTRKFAEELSVSRVTVVTAYDQLTAEGYIESRHGSGAFVAHGLPDPDVAYQKSMPFVLQTRDTSPPAPVLPFQPASPDMALFPHQQWAKLFQRVWSNPSPGMLANADPFGWWQLRVQIADHLRVWRGIHCQPVQVIVTSGASEAMQTIADALFAPSQLPEHLPRPIFAHEEPGYDLFSRVLARSQISTTGVLIDDNGLQVDRLSALQPQPAAAIVTPSRQYPTGITMPLARRLQLLDWAGQDDRFVIEDDYDSEYRYVGQPLPALMSLAGQGRVIYLGSFSKVFSKSLRLGYLVVAPELVEKFRQTLVHNGPGAAGLAQPVLAQFMASGAYASHIRRMRRTYSARQKLFVQVAKQYLEGLIEFEPAGGGMHLLGRLGDKLSGKLTDVEICQRARDAGIVLQALSDHYSARCKSTDTKQGVIAGYAGFDEDQLVDAVIRLAKVLAVST